MFKACTCNHNYIGILRKGPFHGFFFSPFDLNRGKIRRYHWKEPLKNALKYIKLPSLKVIC